MTQENIAAVLYQSSSAAASIITPQDPSTLVDLSLMYDYPIPPCEAANFEGAVNLLPPTAFQAALSTNDTLTQSAMLKA